MPPLTALVTEQTSDNQIDRCRLGGTSERQATWAEEEAEHGAGGAALEVPPENRKRAAIEVEEQYLRVSRERLLSPALGRHRMSDGIALHAQCRLQSGSRTADS